MPKKTFAIAFQGRRATLKIEHGRNGRDVVVSLGKREIGHFKNVHALVGGQILKTPIGRISIKYKKAVFGITSGGYSVWHELRHLKESVDHPSRIWRAGYQVALFLGVVNILIGLFILFNKNSILSSMFLGPLTLAIGVLTIILGLWAWKGRTGTPLFITALIFGADGLLTILGALSLQQFPNLIGLMIRVAFVITLWRGGTAARDLEPEDKAKHPYEKVKNS